MRIEKNIRSITRTLFCRHIAVPSKINALRSGIQFEVFVIFLVILILQLYRFRFAEEYKNSGADKAYKTIHSYPHTFYITGWC